MTKTKIDREQVKQAAREAAWDEGQECPTCHEGKIPGGRKLIHSVSPHGFGADWDLDAVLDAIDADEDLWWNESLSGHDLKLLVGGKVYRFNIQSPARTAREKP